MTSPLAQIEVEEKDGTSTIILAGEIDLSNATDVEQQLFHAVANARRVVLDLLPVTYIDSRGVRLLLELSQRLKESGVPLTLVAPPDSPAGGVLRIVRFPGVYGDDASP